jgi:hypothetical protein
MIGIVQPPAAAVRRAGSGFVRFCDELCVCSTGADSNREEIARRHISRQHLAGQGLQRQAYAYGILFM